MFEIEFERSIAERERNRRTDVRSTSHNVGKQTI